MTNHNLGSKKIIKDIIIVGIVVLVIWVGLQLIFGTANPFYVVSSGSMIPTLEVYDVIVVRGNIPFEDIKRGFISDYKKEEEEIKEGRNKFNNILDSLLEEGILD